MDGGGGGNAMVASKNLFMGIAAATGAGCLALYAWNRWWQCEEEEEAVSHGGTTNGGYVSLQQARNGLGEEGGVRGMGQNQGIHLNGTAYEGIDQSGGYSPIDTLRGNGSDDWSITVNPREETENQQLIQATSSTTSNQAAAALDLAKKDHEQQQRRFKRVIFRSRMDENEDGDDAANGTIRSPNGNTILNSTAAVVTSQPKTTSTNTGGGPIVLTNLRLADKLRGFSNEEYQNTLQGTLNRLYGSTKILTVEEAKCLTLLLQQKSPDTLLKTLTTMSNLAAFTINQDLLREQGAIDLLVNMLRDESLTDSAQVMLVQCIGNTAVNQTNNKLLQCRVPRIIQHLLSPTSSELQRVMCIQALTNLSVDSGLNKAGIYSPILPVLYERLWSYKGVNIPTLRLLVNLSCTANMVPYMLATEIRTDLLDLIDESNSSKDDVSVRATTLLFYMASTVDTLGLDESEIRSKSPTNGGGNFERTVYFKLFYGDGARRFQAAIDRLRLNENEEVRQRTTRIATHLANIRETLNGGERQ